VAETKPLSKNDSELYYNTVKEFFDHSLLTKNFNGGVLIAKGNSIIFEQYSGYKDLRTKDEITGETPMHVASVSKTFTGIAVLQLIQQGKVHLDDPLSTYFPNFPYEGVTVQMLLDHRSGIPNYVHYLPAPWEDEHEDQYATNQDVLNSLYQMKLHPEFSPGKRFSYSNTNFLLLSMIVEKVTGERFPDYMQKNIFDQLGMKDTYIFSMADSATATRSYRGNSLWDWDCLDNTYGDKNVYTTPRDLLKWSRAIMGGELVRQSLLDSAFTPYSNEKRSVHNYGLGWRLLMLPNGKKVVYHNGRWHGSNAAFAMLPDEDVTIIIIGNKYNANIYSAARRSYDLFGNYLQNGNGGDDEEKESMVRHVSRHHHKKYYAHSKSHGAKKSYVKKNAKRKPYAGSSKAVVRNTK
jgi:CubicO group peptidase (beta-lactamase class C family)